MSMDTSEVLDLSKENIQPLRQGRNVCRLETALQARNNIEVQQQLRREKELHESLIRTYEGEDPLQPYWDYVSWLEQSYPHQGPENNLEPLLEIIITKFREYEKYKQDPRFVRILIKYISLQQNPLELYQMVYNQGLGIYCSSFYKAWAEELDNCNDFKRADGIFQLGLNNGAHPLSELNEAHMQFQLAVGRRLLKGDIGFVDKQTGDEARPVLTRLKSNSISTSRKHEGSAGVLPLKGGGNKIRKASIKVYNETSTRPKLKPENKPTLEELPKGLLSNIENIRKPGKWCGEKQKIPFELLPISTTPSFIVHQDSVAPSTNRKTVTVLNALKPKKEHRCPIAIFEPPNPNLKPMYPKHLVYAGGRDFSLEEIRAEMFWKSMKTKELQQQRVNDDGNNLVPVERVSIPFACENNGNEPIITNDNDGSSIDKFNPENNRVIEQQIGTDFDKKEITVGYMFGASDVNGINLETNQNVSNKSIDTSQMEKQSSIEKVHQSSLFDIPIGSAAHSPSTSITVNTRAAMNVIQQMWTSPSPKPCRQKPIVQDDEMDDSSFKIPIIPKAKSKAPFRLYNDEDDNMDAVYPLKPTTFFTVFSDNQRTADVSVKQSSDKFPNTATTSYATVAPVTSSRIDRENFYDLAVPLEIEDNQCQRELVVPYPKLPPLPFVPPPPDDDKFDVLSSEDQENEPPIDYVQSVEKRRTFGVLVPRPDIPIADPDDVGDNSDEEEENAETIEFHNTDHNKMEVNFDDITCNTKAFAFELLSSTPFGKQLPKSVRKSLTLGSSVEDFRSTMNTLPTKKTAVSEENLSIILETSKERYTSSSGSSGNSSSAAMSKTFVLTEKLKGLGVIQEQSVEMNDDDDENGVAESRPVVKNNRMQADCCYDEIIDPFDENVISRLLNAINLNEHTAGYFRINCNLPAFKSSSVIKLGNEKWTVNCEIGKGAYAKVFRAESFGKLNTEYVALKIQKPACEWEFYIIKELHSRLNAAQRNYFVNCKAGYIYNNGSALLSKWAPYGTLLDFVSRVKLAKNVNCPMYVCTNLIVQMISSIEYLHSCQIIHGDVKPDNFIITDMPSVSKTCIQLIDFGRSIDMRLFPAGTKFTRLVTTDGFQCHEMRDNKPWTYQTDLYGLAGSMYVVLMGDYMKTIKRDDTWTLVKPLPRYMRRDIWDPIFDQLLNIPSCDSLPNLTDIKNSIKQLSCSFDQYTIQQQLNIANNILSKK